MPGQEPPAIIRVAMFLNTMITTFSAAIQILVMGAAGFVLVRRGFMDTHVLDRLNALLVKFLLPCLIFFQLTTRFDFERFPNWWFFPLLCLTLVAGGMAVARVVLIFNRGCGWRRHFLALSAFSNGGYIPLLMITVLFAPADQETLFVYLFLFIMGFDASLWSLGSWLVTSQEIKGMSLKRVLTPPFLTTLTALVVVFFGINRWIPAVLLRPIELFGGCVLPVAMLVVGGSLARLRMEHLLVRDLGWLVMAKLILLPLIALGVVEALRLDFLLGYFIILQACVPSATSLSLLGMLFNTQRDFINSGILVTHLVSVVTMPLFLAWYIYLYSLR